MPIHPDLKRLYPSDWKEISRRIRFIRAGGRCEACGAPHWAFRMPGGVIVPPGLLERVHLAYTIEEAALVGLRLTRVILTTAHLNHNPTDNHEENLAALCQRCHLAHDLKHHLTSRRVNREKETGQGRLFEREAQ